MHESMKQKLVNEKFPHVLKNIFYVVFEHGKKSIETKVNKCQNIIVFELFNFLSTWLLNK